MCVCVCVCYEHFSYDFNKDFNKVLSVKIELLTTATVPYRSPGLAHRVQLQSGRLKPLRISPLSLASFTQGSVLQGHPC